MTSLKLDSSLHFIVHSTTLPTHCREMKRYLPGRRPSNKLNSRRIEELPSGRGVGDGKQFISSDRMSSFKRSYCNRRVFNGRRVDLSDFGESDITAMIDALGWTPIICMDHKIFPRLVRLFYCNFEFDRQQPSITSLVNGTSIHITCDSLSVILGIPNEGIKCYKSGTWDSSDCHILDALRLVCGNDKIMASVRPHIRSLPARNRLLHDMVMSMFLPRGCSRDRVSRTDLFLLKKILCGERVNLPYMIIHHMIDSLSNKYLPYGMLLTKVFVACNVDIANDEVWEPLKRKEVYNSLSIRMMGYVQREKGWKPKEALGNLDEEAMGEDGEEEVAAKMEEPEAEEEEEATIVTEEKQGIEEMEMEKLTTTNTMDEAHEEGDGVQGDLSSSRPKMRSHEADDIYESLNKLSARVDTLALSLENLRCQQEQGFASLTTKLDNLMDFLNSHFWPYPPPPSPFTG